MAGTQGSTRGRKAGTGDKPVTVDWANAETATGELPKRMQASIVDDTPFPGWYFESWETGEARILTGLTEAQAEEAKRLVNITVPRFARQYAVKAGVRHHTAQEDGVFTYSFLAVDRTKAGEDDAEQGIEEDGAEEASE